MSMSTKPRLLRVLENNRDFAVYTTASDADALHIDSTDYAESCSRCDYAIRVSPLNPRHFFFVELKGNDVVKAAKQLVCSIEHLKSLYKDYSIRQAWVISGGWRPAVKTSFQIQKAKAKKHNFLLQHRTRSMTVDLTRL